ncbi:MAG: hypothetical protein PVJ67_04100 [Candidatus Pacearchaeota archaeon]
MITKNDIEEAKRINGFIVEDFEKDIEKIALMVANLIDKNFAPNLTIREIHNAIEDKTTFKRKGDGEYEWKYATKLLPYGC